MTNAAGPEGGKATVAGADPPSTSGVPSAQPPSSGTPDSSKPQLVDMPLGQLTAAVAQAMAAVASIKAALPRPSRLSPEERKLVSGRIQEGESAVLKVLVETAQQPAYAPLLVSLSDQDLGVDPDAFEPALLGERLEKVEVLAPLAHALAHLSDAIGDTMIELEQLARDPLLDAYAILKSAAKTDPALKSRLLPVIRFYAARAAARRRAAASDDP